LKEAGDVDRALTQFYEETLAAALADPAAAEVSERQLRTWFDEELITAAGTRGLVHQDADDTGGLPNAVVKALQRRFLVRAEARGGDTWIELVHDRFVEPIRASNAAWFPQHLSTLQRQAALWNEQGRSSGLLLRDAALAKAEAWAADHTDELEPYERDFLSACQAELASARRERRQRSVIGALAIVAGVVAILATILFFNARAQTQRAEEQTALALEAKSTAQAEKLRADENAKLARDQLDRQAGLALLQGAYAMKEKGDVQGAIEKFRAAKATQTDLGVEVEAEIEDVRRLAATRLVQQGEALAKGGNFVAAEAQFNAVRALAPPPDTPVYVYVPEGPFFMGPDTSSAFTGTLPAYWIQRTEVTNAQYLRCVKAGESGEKDGCKSPADGNIRYRDPQFAKQPVTGITWFQAQAYAAWAGGRLPTEAEWEKACRGTAGRTYPWGEQNPTRDLLNYSETGLGTWSAVGSYPGGASPYEALDMAGNAWEWTSSALTDYPYNPKDGREGPSANVRVLRGGSFGSSANSGVRCAYRHSNLPADKNLSSGFRVVVSPGL
jgi:formylglycine-generating enzyme required for sulfatase activity